LAAGAGNSAPLSWLLRAGRRRRLNLLLDWRRLHLPLLRR
jgi:hypothetical protein